MSLNQKRLYRAFTIFFIICILGFLTFNSINQVHNTTDPYFARKIVLRNMAFVVTSLAAGGFILYFLRGQIDLSGEKREE